MNESLPNQEDNEKAERNIRLEEMVNLAKELSESGEVFPFTDINPVDYPIMKADEQEFPGYTTPVDELISRFKKEGMKIMLDEKSQHVFVVPAQGENTEQDIYFFPRQLQISEGMNEKLKKLILLSLSFKKS